MKRLIGSLIIILLATAIYIQMDDVRLRIDDAKTTFYVYENRWLVSGVEYNKLFNGTKLVYRHAKDVNWFLEIENNITQVFRTTPYYSGSLIKETYTFNGSNTNVELFPVSHEIEIYNATGLIYQYEVKRLKCDRITEWDVTSPQEFGRNMKVEWDGNPYFTKVYKYKNTDECKLTIKYRIDSDYTKLNIRLFDPPAFSVTLNSPVNETTTSDSTPDFNFTVSGTENSYSCELFIKTNISTTISDYKYNNINISTQDNIPTGLFFKSDGTKLYEVGCGGDKIYQSTCSNAWNLSSCSYNNVNILTQDTSPRGIFFKSDGTKLYEVGTINDKIYQYSCSNAWNLSSCSYNNINISTQDSFPTGIFFKSDGIKLYEMGGTNDKIHQYSCSDAWNLSSCSYDNVYMSSQDSISQELFFKLDGTKLYEVGENSKKIHQYSCSNAWNLSSCSYDSIYISTQDLSPSGLFFKSDETKLYEIGYSNDKIYQYDLDYISYGTNNSVLNNTVTLITANTSLNNGTYPWYINCSNDTVTNQSEIRELSIDLFTITSCKTLDLENGVYTLGSNISSTGTCITIAANNITLDGNGYTINYSTTIAGYGIKNAGFDNTTIKNCNLVFNPDIVYAAMTAIQCYNFYDYSNYLTIYNNNISHDSCTGHGIYVRKGNYANIYNNIINISYCPTSGAGSGIEVFQMNDSNIYNNNITVNEAYSGITVLSNVDNVSVYNNNIYGDAKYGIHMQSSNSNYVNNDITITGTGFGFFLGFTLINNNITNGSIISNLNYSYYIDNQHRLNLFKDTNFTERIILFEDPGTNVYVQIGSLFSYTNTADEVIILHTKMDFSGNSKAVKRKLAEWSSIYITWNETNQSEDMEGFYNITGLKTNHEYNVTNTTTSGTTTTLIDTDASGNLEFSIVLDGTTTITVQPELNITIYINGYNATGYFEITEDLNISAYSNVAGGTMCIGIDNPLFGDNYSCSSDYYEALLDIIPAIDTFNDSTSNKTLISDDTIYFTLNNHSEIQTIYINLSSLATNLSFGINSFEHNILGVINNTIANISTISTGDSSKDMTFMGSSVNVIYINIPTLGTITSAKFNISSPGSTITQNKLNDIYTNKTYITNATNDISFYISVPLASTIDSIKFNISAEPYTYTLGTPDSISCSGENVINCNNAFGTGYAQSSDNTDSSTTLTVESEWDVYNITNITAEFSNYASASYNGLTDMWLQRNLYIYNYGTTGWSNFKYDGYYKISSGYSTNFAGIHPVTNPQSGLQKLKLKTVTTSITGTSTYSSHTARQYTGNIIATKTVANATIDMLNNGIDDNIEVSNTMTTVELNKTLLQAYLDTCTTDPCEIPFSINSSHEDNDRVFEISGIELKYNNNPKNITIDIGDNGNIDYSYLNDLNTTTSPQQVELNITAINAYLTSCTGTCSVPFMIYSKQGGNLTIENIEVLYTFNPIALNITAGNNYLYSNTNNVDIPINFTATSWGQTNITNLNVSFYGDANYTITANYGGDYVLSASDTIDLNLIWSNYSIQYPTGTSFFRWYPTSNNDKNVTPYGQTTTPFFNITGLQRDLPFDLYIRVNESYVSTINLTASNTSTKSDLVLNTTWQLLTEDILTSVSSGVWYWLDLFNVNTTDLRYLKTYIETKSVCSICVI